MTFESEELNIVAIYIWLLPASYVVFLKTLVISYSMYETRCVFYIPSPKARVYKTHNWFHIYRMKWKFISDPIYI